VVVWEARGGGEVQQGMEMHCSRRQYVCHQLNINNNKTPTDTARRCHAHCSLYIARKSQQEAHGAARSSRRIKYSSRPPLPPLFAYAVFSSQREPPPSALST